MLKSFLLFLIVLFITFSYTQAQNIVEPIKIGVIDINRVINTSKYGQEVMEKLQKKYEEIQAKIDERVKELEALKEEIEKKGALWSQEQREKKQSEYQKKLRELKALQEDAQFEMQEYERKLLDPIFKELETIIKNYVEKEKYDLIMEKSQPGIYYASPKIDLSPIIVDLFDKHYEETKGKTTQSTIKSDPTKTKEPTKAETPTKK
ncbi:MAG: OmpH family outer membrane protein [Caldimicrobium sp.]